MTPEAFVAALRAAVIEENVDTYRELLASTSPETATDAYWRRALAFYRVLDEDQRAVLLDIMRQVAIDTVSNVLGILDGVSGGAATREDFVLVSASDECRLNGSLQDLFLEVTQAG
ncbi:MAG: transposase [Myxococcales bacterium]|nr:transposase [Myxococcales bacterium]